MVKNVYKIRKRIRFGVQKVSFLGLKGCLCRLKRMPFPVRNVPFYYGFHEYLMHIICAVAHKRLMYSDLCLHTYFRIFSSLWFYFQNTAVWELWQKSKSKIIPVFYDNLFFCCAADCGRSSGRWILPYYIICSHLNYICPVVLSAVFPRTVA